jgi:hypothetical protein
VAAGSCLYRGDPPDDEQQTCAKHVEAYYLNKSIEKSASYWFILYQNNYFIFKGSNTTKNLCDSIKFPDCTV